MCSTLCLIKLPTTVTASQSIDSAILPHRNRLYCKNDYVINCNIQVTQLPLYCTEMTGAKSIIILRITRSCPIISAVNPLI